MIALVRCHGAVPTSYTPPTASVVQDNGPVTERFTFVTRAITLDAGDGESDNGR